MRATLVATVVALCLLCAHARTNKKTCPAENQKPIIFVPGLYSSVLEGYLSGIPSTVPLPHSSCKRTSKKWETFWMKGKNLGEVDFDCLTSSMSFTVDPITGVTKDIEGVSIRPPNFGKLTAVEKVWPMDPTQASDIFHTMIKNLKKLGFKESVSLYGAPYDWRHFPLASWMNDTRVLIEGAVKSAGAKAVLVSHSMGCPYIYEFLMAQPIEWRQEYIGKWIALSPVMAGTPIAPFTFLASKIGNFPIIGNYTAPLARMCRTLEEHYYISPKTQYGDGTEVFFKSNNRSYTLKDLPELTDRAGIRHGRVLLKKAQDFVDKTGLKHPGIPTKFFISHGVKTIGGGIFNDESEIGKKDPKPFFVDGDILVTTQGLRTPIVDWVKDEKYADITEMVDLEKVDHKSMLYRNEVLESVSEAACTEFAE